MSVDENRLLWGIKNGDLDAVKEVVEKPSFSVDAVILNGRNGLHYAADYGQANVVEYLCNKGAKVDLPDKHGITPLLAAIYEDHEDCVKILTLKGAKKDGKTPDGLPYIQIAQGDGIKKLLQ